MLDRVLDLYFKCALLWIFLSTGEECNLVIEATQALPSHDAKHELEFGITLAVFCSIFDMPCK